MCFSNADVGKLLIGVIDGGAIKPLTIDNVLVSRVQDTIHQIEPRVRVKLTNEPVNLLNESRNETVTEKDEPINRISQYY